MDTTEKNVKMCEKAEKIQKLSKFEEGNVFCIPKGTDFEYNDELGGEQLKESLIVILKNIGGGRYYGYTMKSYGFEVGTVFSEDPHGRIYKLEDVVWLPRQDELQDMMGIESIPTLLSQFNEFVFKNVSYVSQFIDSLEKTWLAFVMKEKYNKVWSGKEWI